MSDYSDMPRTYDQLMERTLVHITQSAVTTAMTCMQRFAFRYLYHLSPRTISIPLVTGRAFHKAIEYVILHNNNDDVLGRTYDIIDKEIDAVIEKSDLLEPDKLAKLEVARGQTQAMIGAWYIINGDFFDAWKVIETELVIRNEGITLDSAVCDRMCGKLDGIYEATDTDTGDTWLVEHKTRASLSGLSAESLTLDTQLLWYWWLAVNACDVQTPSGVLYNAIQKPQHRMNDKGYTDLRQRMSDAMVKDPDKYFMCEPVLIEGDAVKRAAVNFERWIKKLDHLQPQDFTMETCSSHNSPCTAYGGCTYRSMCLEHVDTAIPNTVYNAAALNRYVIELPHSELDEE